MKTIWLIFTLIIAIGLPWSSWVVAVQYDPMAPPGYGKVVGNKSIQVKKTKQRYYLRQILVKESGNSAVINGYLVKEGEYVNRAKVIKIETNKVTLSKAGKLSVIRLNDPVKKVRQ